MHVDSTPALFASQASASSGEGVPSAASEGAFATVMATSMREAEAHVPNSTGIPVAIEEKPAHPPSTPHEPATAEQQRSLTPTHGKHQTIAERGSGITEEAFGPDGPPISEWSTPIPAMQMEQLDGAEAPVTHADAQETDVSASTKAGAALTMQAPTSPVQVSGTDKPAVLGEEQVERTDGFSAQDGRQPRRDEILTKAGSINPQEALPTPHRPTSSSDDAGETRISREEAPELVERAVTDKPAILGEEIIEAEASEVLRDAAGPVTTQRENQEPRAVSLQDAAPKLEGADGENGQPVQQRAASQASILSEAQAPTNEKLRIIDASDMPLVDPDAPLANPDTPQVQADQTGQQQRQVEASREKHVDSASQPQQALAETSEHGDGKTSSGRAERQEALRPDLQSAGDQPDEPEAIAKADATGVRGSEASPNLALNQNGERLNQIFTPESSDSANVLGNVPGGQGHAASTMGTFQAATLPAQPWTSRSGKGQEESAVLASRGALGTNTTSAQPGTDQESRDMPASGVLPEDHRQEKSFETRPNYTSAKQDVAALTGDVGRANGPTDQALSVEESTARGGGSQHASGQSAPSFQPRTATGEKLQPSQTVDITSDDKFNPVREYPKPAFTASSKSQGSTEAKPSPDGDSQVSGGMPTQEQRRANGATNPAHTAEMLKPADSLVDRAATERPEVASPVRTASPIAASSESIRDEAVLSTSPPGKPEPQIKAGSSIELEATFSKGTDVNTSSDAISADTGATSQQQEAEKIRPATLNQPNLPPKTGAPTVAEKTETPTGSPIPVNQEKTSGKVEQVVVETAGADSNEAQRAAMTTSRAQEPSHERFGTPLASRAKHAMASAPADLSSRSFFEQSVVLDGPEKPEISPKTHIQPGDGDVASAVKAGVVATEASGKSFEATEKNSRSTLEAASATAGQATATSAEHEQPQEDTSHEDKPAFSGAQVLASSTSDSVAETAFGDEPSIVELIQPDLALPTEQALPEEEVVATEVLDSELTVLNAGSSESRSSLGSTMTSTLNRSVLSAAWLRTMTQSQLPFSVGDGWQVLEMKLDEGDGTVTIKAKPGDERVAVSVGFSDPTLRALASAQVDRIQEALQEAYNTSVDLSFADGSNASTGQQANDEQGGSGSVAPTAALPGTEPEADRGLRTRMTGALNEWVG